MLKIITFCIFCITLLNSKASAEQILIESEAIPDFVDNVAFIKLGTYRGFTDNGAEYQKTFFLSRYSVTFWAESISICKAFDFDLVTMESLEEANALLTMAGNNSIIDSSDSFWIWSGGITLLPKTSTSWYWAKTGEKISFPIPWTKGHPSNTEQYCLAFGKLSQNQKLGFLNGYCSGKGTPRFVCQRTDFYIP